MVLEIYTHSLVWDPAAILLPCSVRLLEARAHKPT